MKFHRLGLPGLVLLFVLLTFLFVASDEPEPTSHGMTVSAWLNQPFEDFDSMSKVISQVEGFGPDAIPFFIAEFRSACSERPRTSWDGMEALRKYLGIPTQSKTEPENIQCRALLALGVLGREHGERVDPFFMDLLDSTNRWNAIGNLGFMGNRHFTLLTNMIAGTNEGDFGAALWSLRWMGTNAQSAIPLALNAINHWAESDSSQWSRLWFLDRSALDHEQTLSYLFSLLEHLDKAARNASINLLSEMTDHYAEIAPEFARMPDKPMVGTNDPGERIVLYLHEIGVLPNIAVPLLMRRLRYAVDNAGADPYPNKVLTCCRRVAVYGPDGTEMIPLIEERILPQLQAYANTTLEPAPITKNEAERAIEALSRSLRQVDPSWRLPHRRKKQALITI